MPTYDIISCSWHYQQTKVWLHHVRKHCPDAAIHLIPDSKPVPWCWSGGKLDCFSYDKFKTNRVIYMDTDTIVTKDLDFVFDDMEDRKVGLSSRIEIKPFDKQNHGIKWIQKMSRHCNWHFRPIHYSSGMMVFKDTSLYDLWQPWFSMMFYKPFLEICKGYALAEEASLAFVVPQLYKEEEIYHIPYETHGNLLGGRKWFGGAEYAAVIHYHKTIRLKKHGLEKFLEIGDEGERSINDNQSSESTLFIPTDCNPPHRGGKKRFRKRKNNDG